jgi:hypothetical protein
MPRRARIGLWLAAIVVTMLLVGRGCVFRPTASHDGAHYNQGANAAWLGIEWVNEVHSTADVEALAADLRKRQIRDAYVYVSYLRPSGQFGETFSQAPNFTSALNQAAPEIRLHAWLGVPVKAASVIYGDGSGHADLANANVRGVITRFAARAIESGGFDGVHLDPEPLAEGDPALLQLLEETRSAIGKDALLSIATPRIRPLFAEVPSPAIGPATWSAGYYREVAKRVDQIALMTYDSALPHPALYRQWSRFQVIELSRALDGSGAELLIGVPTSRESTFTHRPDAETMESGLLGTIDGLNDAASRPHVVTGVAIYPYWEADTSDWSTYQRLWLGQQRP